MQPGGSLSSRTSASEPLSHRSEPLSSHRSRTDLTPRSTVGARCSEDIAAILNRIRKTSPIRGVEYDMFISYRRSDGIAFARSIYQAMKSRNVSAFLDKECLPGGRFDDSLVLSLARSTVFVMVITPDYLSAKRFPDPEDWCRKEVEYAVGLDKHVVPVIQDKGGKDWAFEACKALGEEVEELLGEVFLNDAVFVSEDYFEASMNKLQSHLCLGNPQAEPSGVSQPRAPNDPNDLAF